MVEKFTKEKRSNMIEIEWILTKDVLKETANGAFSYSKRKIIL